MKFEILEAKNAAMLLSFESENRKWFESLISPREDSFYSAEGIKEHIESQESGFKRGDSMSLILSDGEAIIARANLKNICVEEKSAEVGYRVAERHIGKGIGSSCVGELIRRAVTYSSIIRLRAKVLDNNPASKRVLEKQHFEFFEYEPEKYEVNGMLFGCTTLERILRRDESE